MADTPTILVAESNQELAKYLRVALSCHGFDVEVSCTAADALSYLARPKSHPSAALVNAHMPSRSGLDVAREMRRRYGTLPVILYSQDGGSVTEAQAKDYGASGFLTLPAGHATIVSVIRQFLPPGESAPFTGERTVSELGDFLCVSSRMRALRANLKRLAATDVPVVFCGESGSGKEVLARALHMQSSRAGKHFVKFNCAAVPSELLESELFGYERGAFTGAFRTHAGKFEQAEGGTILLDEIGDMELRLQAKLLHVLQDRAFQRLGGRDTIHVDVRVLAATHRDLEAEVAEGRFRADLYYRLNVIRVDIPPLRERTEEILPFVDHFLRKHAIPSARPAVLPEEFTAALMDYDWPGNVRELENVVQRLVVLQDARLIREQLLASMQLRRARAAAGGVLGLRKPQAEETGVELAPFDKVNETKAQLEENFIRAALDHTRWNRKEAAQLLKIEYKALLYKMKKLNISPEGKSRIASASAA